MAFKSKEKENAYRNRPEQREKKRKYMRKRYRENPRPQIEYAQEYDKKRRKIEPEAYRAIQYKRRYGITIEQFDAMVVSQNGLCAICQEPFPPIRKKMAIHVDHCHDTNHVRGLLCARCNVGLGLFGDSIDRLVDASAYLKRGML